MAQTRADLWELVLVLDRVYFWTQKRALLDQNHFPVILSVPMIDDFMLLVFGIFLVTISAPNEKLLSGKTVHQGAPNQNGAPGCTKMSAPRLILD